MWGCKHDYQVLSETTLDSQFEVAIKSLKSIGVASEFKIPGNMCDAERTHIQIVTCKKCGKLKRFVEKI